MPFSPPSPQLTNASTREALLKELESQMAEVRVRQGQLHLAGVRDAVRQELAFVIDRAETWLSGGGVEGERPLEFRRLLVEALLLRAEDARYGAGQLSRGAQRAPTTEDCEDGWQRVEEIVRVAEGASARAQALAGMLDEVRARRLAERAGVAAQRARQIVRERNHAYTFHADPRFSFGEGWYLAAAGVLGGVIIQIEPQQLQTAQAERFLHDAGLGAQLVSPRPRPRANKALPAIVAAAFRKDPAEAQARLRAAFLGPGPVAPAVAAWADARLETAPPAKKVLLWVRYGSHHPTRNTDHGELTQLCALAFERGLVPVLVGDALRGSVPPGAVDLTLFWKLPLFQGIDMRRAQLQLFEHLRAAHGVIGQVGVTTAGMDGPALLGLPTRYLTAEPNVRLGKWVGAVPDYEEVVRRVGDQDALARALRPWSGG